MSKKRKQTPSSGNRSVVEVLIAKYGLMGTVIASVFGLVGVCLTAYLGYLGIQAQIEVPIKATQTAEARDILLQTPLPPTHSLSNTPQANNAFSNEVPQIRIEQSLFHSQGNSAREAYRYFASIKNEGRQSAVDVSLVIFLGIMNPFEPSGCSLRAPYDNVSPRQPNNENHVLVYSIEFLPSGGEIDMDCTGELKYGDPVVPSILMYSETYDCLVQRDDEKWFNLDGVPYLEFTAKNVSSESVTYCHHFTRP